MAPIDGQVIWPPGSGCGPSPGLAPSGIALLLGMASKRMRAQVAESWPRSAAAGVEADTMGAPITLPNDALRDYREAHPLAQVFPVLDDVLGQAARDCDANMAVSDATGQLLWVSGHPSVLPRAESIGFVEGAHWDERIARTSAPA